MPSDIQAQLHGNEIPECIGNHSRFYISASQYKGVRGGITGKGAHWSEMIVDFVQEQEPRLPNLLKMIVWSQQQLDEKLSYPRINNLVTAELTSPT